MLLFVIKQGDLGRRDWDNGEPTSIRPSINEVLDVYLTKLVAPEHTHLRKIVILATTGDLKQDAETNWTAFKESNTRKAAFDFWGADRVSDLVERYLLNENLFVKEDRSDLRRSLALAADPDYDFRDLNRLLLRQLGLMSNGKTAKSDTDIKALQKSFRRAHLAAQICALWAQADGDSRQALWISERCLLWAWHRVQLISPEDRPKLYPTISGMWNSYTGAATTYFERISPHLYVRDGMAGYGGEGAAFAVVLFEHIGLIASIGLACALDQNSTEEGKKVISTNVQAFANGLCALIKNHGASASPRLDAHVIDISLALVFLALAGRQEEAKSWLAEIAKRLDYCFKVKSRFPVSTDSLEDLVELETQSKDSKLSENLMRTSWTLATVAAWCAIFDLDEHYSALSAGATDSYKSVCAQLWHPTGNWHTRWYFDRSSLDCGETEAPYVLPTDIEELRKRMADFLTLENYDWVASSPSRDLGIWALDFIACQHFRIPVPASIWYRLLDTASH
jgi:hypothetical protein